MTEFKPGQKVRRTDPESSSYCYFGEVVTLIDLFDDTPCWNVLRSTGEKVQWNEDNFELVLTPADLGNHIDFDAMQSELHEGDRVQHGKFGEGTIPDDGVSIPIDIDAETAVVRFDNAGVRWVPIGSLSKIEPESEEISVLEMWIGEPIWDLLQHGHAYGDGAFLSSEMCLAIVRWMNQHRGASPLEPVEDSENADIKDLKRSRLAAWLRLGEVRKYVIDALPTSLGLHDYREKLIAFIDNGLEPQTSFVPKRRLQSCVDQWPECTDGAYDPHCCRFPKPCSATVYNDDIADELLEPSKATEEPICNGNCNTVGDLGLGSNEGLNRDAMAERDPNCSVHGEESKAKERSCEHCGYSNNAHALGCKALSGNPVYHAGIVIQEDLQSDMTLREKFVEAIELLQTTAFGTDANLIAGDSLVTMRRHFDSEAITEAIADLYAEIHEGKINGPEFNRKLYSILFGDEK